MSIRALDQSDNLGDIMEPWNSGVSIAETDCFINISSQGAVYEPGARVLLLNFSNLKVGKVAQLSTAGNREPCAPGEWMLAQIRLISALRGEIGTDIIQAVGQADDPFVIRVEVDPSHASEAAIAIAAYLEQFGLNSGVIDDH